MIDPAQSWVIDAPVSPVNNDRFSIVTLSEDLTPATINGSFIGGVSSFLLVWPNATIEFCYAADGPYWFALNLVEPVTARTAADGSGWIPPGADLGIGWDTAELTFDANITKYIAYDDTNNTFKFILPGLYQLILTGTFEHDSSNQGRTTNIRFFNVTDGTAAPGEIIATGRNAEASPFTVAFLVDVDETQWNKDFRIEFGGGDSYSLVEFNALDLQIVGIEPTIYFPIAATPPYPNLCDTDFSTWTLNNVAVTPSQPDVNGGNTAALITDDATNGEHRLYYNTGAANTQQRRVLLKAGTASYASINVSTTSYAVVNLTNGNIESQANVTPTVNLIADGWYEVTVDNPSSSPWFIINMGTTAANAVPGTSYSGVGDTIQVSGASHNGVCIA